eukprot:scaffold2534_cov260-Pinguiococcus_pyrenoidosus.AAC.8
MQPLTLGKPRLRSGPGRRVAMPNRFWVAAALRGQTGDLIAAASTEKLQEAKVLCTLPKRLRSKPLKVYPTKPCRTHVLLWGPAQPADAWSVLDVKGPGRRAFAHLLAGSAGAPRRSDAPGRRRHARRPRHARRGGRGGLHGAVALPHSRAQRARL